MHTWGALWKFRSTRNYYRRGSVFRMGSGEMLVVLFVAMLFLGPEQIKALVKRWSEMLKIVRQTTQQLTDDVDASTND